MRRGIVLIAALTLTMTAAGDSLFRKTDGKSGTLISQKKARFEVGDIITVVVNESIDALTQADTNTKKEGDIETTAAAADNAFLTATRGEGGLGIVDPKKLPNWKIEAENEHRSRGQTKRSNTLRTTISCLVTCVHDNGNIDIEGSKNVGVNREDSSIAVKGTVRAKDVSPGNTVDSNRLANADIQLRGRGPLWNNQRRGILTKLTDWFSPF